MGTFQSFWFGDRLPQYHRLALKSFVDHGHIFHLYTYDQLEVPAGVELRDAQTILPRDRVFLYKHGEGAGGVAGFSDLFRFRLLHEHGGWWVDTDVICLSKHVPEPDIYLGWQDHRLVGSAIIRLPKGSEIALELYEAAERAGTDIRYGDIGPGLITRIVKERGLSDQIRPQEEIYPIGPVEALDIFIPSMTEEVRRKIGNAPLLHIWNEMFGRAAMLKWVAPPLGCYIRELFSRHEIPLDERHCYSPGEMERINFNFRRAINAQTQFRRARRLEAEVAELRKKLAEAESIIAALGSGIPITGGG
jgi:hypothetical protein